MINDDIIAAIATGNVESAVGIVRVSGNGCIELLKRIFKPSRDDFEGYKIYHGYIAHNDRIIDEVLVSVFRSPKSYTGEDSFEISCHGGLLVLRNVLNVVLANGARVAKPGEFTKRAFFNNKIDLIQANAIANIISAKSQKALDISFNQLLKKNASLIDSIREKITFLMAENEVNIDHSDEALSSYKLKQRLEILDDVINSLKKLLSFTQKAKYIFDGATVAIIGKPNVGKSSILNEILGYQRAIVTAIPGTTTDVISEQFILNGVPINILDTAGIRKHSNPIEYLGIQKSNEILNAADVVLTVFDISLPFSEEDRIILDSIKHKEHVIVVLNKSDLPIVLSKTFNYPTIKVSCANHKGFDDLLNRLYYLLMENFVDEQIISLNASQTFALKNAINQAKLIRNSIKSNLDPVLLSIDLSVLSSYIEEIIGKIENEDVLDSVFKNFCVGK